MKRNLMVFLHPVILRDTATTTKISHGKYDYLRAKQIEKREQGVSLMMDSATPVFKPKEEAFKSPSIIEEEPKDTDDYDPLNDEF